MRALRRVWWGRVEALMRWLREGGEEDIMGRRGGEEGGTKRRRGGEGEEEVSATREGCSWRIVQIAIINYVDVWRQRHMGISMWLV